MKLTKVTEVRKVSKTILVDEEVPTGEITITLTAEEASQLARIVYHIGGDPRRTPRSVSESLSGALESAGVKRHPMEPIQSMMFPSSGSFRA